MATLVKPLGFLSDAGLENSFSLRKFFAGIDKGSNAWLFLATKPSARDLTLPLTSCLLELSFCALLDIGINEQRRVWFVVYELASLGRLPASSQIMAEGRKYGACVLAGLQSLNQLYSGYGAYDGSTIFGQFGTNFFFRNNEAAITKMISSMCGQKTIFRQQKNTSFGAHEFRDGVSYTEQEKQKNLVDYNDLSALEIGECFVLLSDPAVRLSRIKVVAANLANKNSGFVAQEVAKIPDSELDVVNISQTSLILEPDLNLKQPNASSYQQTKSYENLAEKDRVFQEITLENKHNLEEFTEEITQELPMKI
jgi:type IV secretory pathway TraG/TraD family ATPase VirD4